MTTWFISRHPGAKHWMQSNGIHFDHHLTHLDDEPIGPGDTVIGSLPVNLAAEICAKGAHYWNLSLLLPEYARGRELSADELDLYQARLEAFRITSDKTAINPALEQVKAAIKTPQQTNDKTTQPAPEQASEQTTTGNSVFTPSKADINQWCDQLFKIFVFNEDNQAKAEQDAARLIEDIAQRVQGDLKIMKALDKTLRHGRDAVSLKAVLQSMLKDGTPVASITEWVEKQKKSQSYRIGRHLQITLDKTNNFRKKKQQQKRPNRDFTITLPYTQLIDGLHPQSLRAMQPAQEWDIYIDETGSQFNADASLLNESDNNLGRIVALALPHGHKLAPLDKPVHAIDLTHEKIQELLLAISQSTSSVLGASLKKDLLSHNWMSAVHQLCRWALLMLPMKDAPTRVRMHIETRSPYDNNAQLLVLQDTLDSELKNLLPERFQQLHLSLHIMGKDNPYNGYVDAIANCWGSTDKTKRQLLARTAWRDHCLLQTTELARIEDIYRNISSGDEVSGYQWFELCAASINEPPHAMLHAMLEQLGQRSHSNPSLWFAYLDETQRRMAQKDFTPASLAIALQWLEDWQQEEQRLPAHLQLTLYSMQLASSNHQGATQLQLVKKLLPLIKQLTDESPEAACQAVLRIAVRGSHLYDFSSSIPLLQQWLNYPIAVPGLLNHAKLQSTMGQLLAFQGQQQLALDYFDQALETLSRLSDNQQKRRDSEQTRLYRAVLMQDMQHADAGEQSLLLVNQATKRSGSQAIAYLARSGSPLRFVHYLLLRLLIKQPALAEQRDSYLNELKEWQSDNSHPWMLIEAYRAWLLHDTQQPQQASEHMQMAIDDCIASGQAMLVWMGHCLHALASSLQLNTTLPAETPAAEHHYPVALLEKLAKAKNNSERLEHLQQLLPFNFH